MGNNINQIAKWCNQHKAEHSTELSERLAFNLEQTRKDIKKLWELLN